MKINERDFETLCICAIRYCHGRQTYMPSLVQEIVKSNFDSISDNGIKVMIDDCDFQQRFNLYGDEKIDKPGWLLWRQALIEEYEKRQGK